MRLNLLLLGFGGVGGGFVQLLAQRSPNPALDLRLVAVLTRTRGGLYHPEGLDLGQLLAHRADLRAYPETTGLVRQPALAELLAGGGVDVALEVTPTDLSTGEPALSHARACLGAGVHYITANKAPIVLAYAELSALAEQKRAFLGFEATVMGGTPALSLGREALAGARILQVRGLLNGTTNYILSQMESGHDYPQALAEAQALGYAEPDPTDDVEGYDTLSKVVILASTVMGAELRPADVPCQGISHLTLADIYQAQAEGERWKLVGEVRREADGRLSASVRPLRLPLSHPLAGVMGVANALTYTTDIHGDVTLIGAGAGAVPTGFALFADLLSLHRLGYGGRQGHG